MTGAYKYALRQTFLIETGDDPDKTQSADQERGNKDDVKIMWPDEYKAAMIDCKAVDNKPHAENLLNLIYNVMRDDWKIPQTPPEIFAEFATIYRNIRADAKSAEDATMTAKKAVALARERFIKPV